MGVDGGSPAVGGGGILDVWDEVGAGGCGTAPGCGDGGPSCCAGGEEFVVRVGDGSVEGEKEV